MNRFLVVDFVILAALGIVLLQGNSQTAVAEDTVPTANAASETGTPVTQLDADSLSFKRSTEASVRTVGDRLRDSVSILDFIPPEEHEAIARRSSTYDCTPDFQTAHDFCVKSRQTLLIPAGKYTLESPVTGVMISMRGDGANNTTIHGTFRSGYMFDFTGSRPYRSIRDLEFVGGGPNGRGRYGGAGAIRISDAWVTNIENLNLVNLGGGISLDRSFDSKISGIKAVYVTQPITATIANDMIVEHVYGLNFTGGYGIKINGGSSIGIRNTTWERGAGSSAIDLRACANVTIDNYYSEKSMGTDITLGADKYGPCYNVTITSSGFTAASETVIDADAVLGLKIDQCGLKSGADVEKTFLKLGTVSGVGPVTARVGHITQITPNTDNPPQRTRPFVKFSSDNSRVFLFNPCNAVGDGTAADERNLAPHTQPDERGRRVNLVEHPVPTIGSLPANLSATSDGISYGPESPGIKIIAETYGAARVTLFGTISNSDGTSPTSSIRLTNAEMGESGTAIVVSPASGGSFQVTVPVSVKPGVNKITASVNQEQGQKGNNSLTVTDLVVL
ncbi:MAG: hypothetical protein MK179_07915 [Pirellulaceae bacterium]|nr:hypothetical protein [Pirellulaceae bacterium]